MPGQLGERAPNRKASYMDVREERYDRLIAAGIGTAPSPAALTVTRTLLAARAAAEARLSTARLGLYSKADR